jgi:hypothetical protein
MSARDGSLSNRTLSSPQFAGKWLRAPVRARRSGRGVAVVRGAPSAARLSLELVSLERAEDAFGRSGRQGNVRRATGR